MEGLCGITRSLIGQPWSSWSTTKDLECDEEVPECEKSKPTADVMRLPKEDMTLFGFCPEQDDFYIVICELCGLGIKPMGMNHHMSLRHSDPEENAKTPSANKTLSKECDSKPKNRKHSSTSIVSDYGHGVGPPPKLLASEAPTISVSNSEQQKEVSQFVAPNNLKLRLEPEKISKMPLNKSHCKQYIQDNTTVVNNTSNNKLPMMKMSRSSKSSHVENIKSSKSSHKPAVPIKSGFRLQLVGTSNCIVFKRNSRSVLNATSELKVRHRRKHRRSRMSHKSKMKSKTASKFLPVLLKSMSTPSPIVAMSPSLAPSPYVALTPLKAVRWNNNVEGVPSHYKPSSHASGGPVVHMGSVMHPPKASEGVMQLLTVDTSKSNGLKPESRMPLLMCKSLPPVRNHIEFNVNQSHMQGNSILVPALLPHTVSRLPDVAWSTVHPKPLGVCPLQTRKVGGLITSDRRLDCVWQSMKSALLEQEAYQATLLCSSSSQPDFHMNNKSSIKTILANLSSNYARNAVCKPTNLGPRPLGINNDKPHSSSLRGIIDASSSVMLISSHHSKILSDPNSFLSHVANENPHAKHSPHHVTTQPFPGIFLRNGHNILPKNLRICLKRRKSIGGINNAAKRLKEKGGDSPVENCRNGTNDHIFPKCIPVLQLSVQNGVSEPMNNFITYTEDDMKKVLHRSDILFDVINSIRRDKITTNGETPCENGRLSMFDQLKSDLMTRFQSIKTASRIVDVNSKAPCRKVAPTAIPNVRLSSAPGSFQVSSPKITYLTTGPVTFQQISPQIGQIQLQSKSNQTAAPIPLKLIGPAQTVSLTASRTLLLNPEKDES